jgi:hypothetical protein
MKVKWATLYNKIKVKCATLYNKMMKVTAATLYNNRVKVKRAIPYKMKTAPSCITRTLSAPFYIITR